MSRVRLYKQCLCNRLDDDHFPFSASDLLTQLCFLWNKITGPSYLQLAALALISICCCWRQKCCFFYTLTSVCTERRLLGEEMM